MKPRGGGRDERPGRDPLIRQRLVQQVTLILCVHSATSYIPAEGDVDRWMDGSRGREGGRLEL